MKLSKLILLPLLMIGLIGCTPIDNQESFTSEEETSIQTHWSYSDEASMKRILHNNVVPYFSKPSGGKWNGVLIGDDGINKTYGIAYEINPGRKEMVTEMRDTLLTLGFIDVTNPNKDEHPKLILKLENYDVNKEVLVAEPQFIARQNTFGGLFYYQADQITWNQNDVDNAILNLLDKKVSLPAPEFSFEKVELYLNRNPENKSVMIGLFTDDESSVQQYYQTLENNGYTGEDIDTRPGQRLYIDKDNLITVTAVYDSNEKVCVIGVFGI